MARDMEIKFTEEAVNNVVTRKDRIRNKLEEHGFNIAYNEITACIEVNNEPINDMVESKVILEMVEHGFHRADIRDAINVVAYENSYHPIKQYFNSLPHTPSTEHIDLFLDCLDIQDKEITAEAIKKWLVGVVARVYEPYQNVVLVLEGSQGIGKTSLARWLAINDNWFTDTDINPDDKDNVLTLSQFLVWELGELERVTSKRDANALKAFITKDKFSIRQAYARYAVHRKAIASFVGTVNSNDYLADQTGNRRYFPVYVNSIDIAYQSIDKDVLWAEVASLYFDGEYDYTLTKEEKEYQTTTNDNKLHHDAVYDFLQDILEPSENGFVSVVDIMTALKDSGFNIASTSRKVKDNMTRLGYLSTRKGKRKQRGYSGCRMKEGPNLSPQEYSELLES
jgi:predicted P-loop ATPase